MSTKNSNFFSRDCMVQALIQLLKTKSLSNITITELTERAGAPAWPIIAITILWMKSQQLSEGSGRILPQDVATWPDKGNYNDSRNMLHCYEYFNHYKEFIACLVQTGLGHLLLQHWTATFWIPIIPKTRAGFLLHAPSLLRFPLQYLCHLDSGSSKESAEEIVSIICKIYS